MIDYIFKTITAPEFAHLEELQKSIRRIPALLKLDDEDFLKADLLRTLEKWKVVKTLSSCLTQVVDTLIEEPGNVSYIHVPIGLSVGKLQQIVQLIHDNLHYSVRFPGIVKFTTQLLYNR